MTTQYPIQCDYSRGELDPLAHARVDLVYYKSALKTSTNFTILRQGGLTRRAGFKFVKQVKDSTKFTRLIPFDFGTPASGIPQAYVLEMGEEYFRVLVNGGISAVLVGTPTAITLNAHALVSIVGHGLSVGDPVLFSNIGGMTELNNREAAVFSVADADNFRVTIDTTTFTAFTSGGTVSKIVEVETPWAQAALAKLDYAQSADTLTVTHRSEAPQEITRTSDSDWTLEEPAFKDGPYYDEPTDNDNGVFPSATNAIHPFMTSANTPSGTVTASSESGGHPGWKAVDGDNSSGNSWAFDGAAATWQYEPASPAVANSYWITVNSNLMTRAPSAWRFQGYDGADWITLDQRSGEASWAPGEIRFYDFINTTEFSKYRFDITGNNGAETTVINELGIGYNGDFGPVITLEFDSADFINDDDGFDSDDVGRPIRLRGSDGFWRWFRISAITNGHKVDGHMFGWALPNTDKQYRWRLGAWRKGSYPSKVGYWQARRAFARSVKEPFNLWLTKTDDFVDHGTSDPLVDDDAIRLKQLTGQINAVTWLADDEALAIGTTESIRVLDRANPNAGFGATNVDAKTKVRTGTAEIKPMRVGQALLTADAFKTAMLEFVYDINSDGYVAPQVSALSAHLLRSGIVNYAFQSSPTPIAWIVTAAGHLVAMIYDREQKQVGLTRVTIAGGDDGEPAVVESVTVVPSADRDEVSIEASLSIDGGTVRYIGQLAPQFQSDTMDLEDANYLDWSLTYDGSPTNTVTGLWHLRGMTVDALADGVVFRELTVSDTGSVTLPNSATASVITVGLRYRSLGENLEIATLSQDGVHIGRPAQAWQLSFSLIDSLGLMVQGMTAARAFPVLKRDNTIDPAAGAMVPRTGIYKANYETSWREGGQFRFYVDDPVPCTIRAAIIGAEGAP